MTNIVPLNSEIHRSLRIKTGAEACRFENERFVPVVIGEFEQLVTHCPIILTKNAQTGQFVVGALLGFEEGENLFADDPVRFDEFRPLNLRRLPFYVIGSDVGIDLESPRLTDRGGERVFGDDGNPGPLLKEVMVHFRELNASADPTRTFVRALASKKLIEPIDLQLSFDDGRSIAVEDVFTVNRDALHELPDAEILELFRAGYLQLIHYMIASLRHIALLADKKNRKLSVFGHG